MGKIQFGIVCFRVLYWECESYISLVRSYILNNKGEFLNIFVFDNTDFHEWFDHHPTLPPFVRINYIRARDNPGISKAYNAIAEFSSMQRMDWIVFLDQDTALPENFYSVYSGFAQSATKGIAVPTVYSDRKLISPSYYRFFRTAEIRDVPQDSLKLQNITCINSGLMISVNDFYRIGKYNEKLRLDFCDHEFIERASKKIRDIHILNIRLYQDFSTDSNDISSALFRYGLFIKDLKTYQNIHHHNPLVLLLVDLPHLLRLTIQYRSLLFIKKRF